MVVGLILDLGLFWAYQQQTAFQLITGLVLQRWTSVHDRYQQEATISSLRGRVSTWVSTRNSGVNYCVKTL